MNRWMQMEESESAAWDNAITYDAMSYSAELVLGTAKGDIFATSELNELKRRKETCLIKQLEDIDEADGIYDDMDDVLDEYENQELKYAKLKCLSREKCMKEMKQACDLMDDPEEEAQKLCDKAFHSTNVKLRTELIQELRQKDTKRSCKIGNSTSEI